MVKIVDTFNIGAHKITLENPFIQAGSEYFQFTMGLQLGKVELSLSVKEIIHKVLLSIEIITLQLNPSENWYIMDQIRIGKSTRVLLISL